MLDWAAGFVADPDCADTLQVIEFANVQLLEFRHIDDRLDDRLEAAYRLIHAERGRDRRPTFWRSHSSTLRSVRELEIEATSLFERADNNLKLIGDQYLSRVFDLARTRFHLTEWQQSIRRKLEVVGDVYDLLVQQAGGDPDGGPRDHRRRPDRPRNPTCPDPALRLVRWKPIFATLKRAAEMVVRNSRPSHLPDLISEQVVEARETASGPEPSWRRSSSTVWP